MKYDFYAELALGDRQERIDQAVENQQEYAILQEADWTTRAQVLATGMASPLASLIKDGKNDKHKIKDGKNDKHKTIGGYPKLVGKCPVFPPAPHLDVAAFALPDQTCLNGLPAGSCLVKLEVALLRPFTSKDDRAFYPHENPLKREWVFQTPYLAAAGVKGLLRWAWRMRFGDKQMEREHGLFGPRNEGLKDGEGLAGCLLTWPLFWRGKVGLEVLNPHDRKSGAGDKPIKYEVVKPSASGSLWLLIVNRRLAAAKTFVREAVCPLFEALDLLIAESGLSAKRSADWGTLKVTSAKTWLAGIADPPSEAAVVSPTPAAAVIDPWLAVMDDKGDLLPFDRDDIFTAKKIAQLTGKSEKLVRGDKRKAAKGLLLQKFADYQKAKQAAVPPSPLRQDEARRQEKPALLALQADSVDTLRADVIAAVAGREDHAHGQ